MVNVSPILSPDKSDMTAHLGLLFGRAITGKVEITGIHVDKETKGRTRTRFFATDDLEAAADYASGLNAQHGWNVYVGAALRKDDVFPDTTADDTDFLRAYALWADADTEAQLQSARAAYAGCDPAIVVVTGRTPERRAQMWWPLETPIDDADTLRAATRGIATALGTDRVVCTAKQLMRLAGSIAWPKQNKPGRVLERTELVRIERAPREFAIEQIERAFPPVTVAQSKADAPPEITVAPAGALGLEEKVMDGREGYAFRLVRATLRQYVGETGSAPTAEELYKEVGPTYFRRVDQNRPGRGPTFLLAKCQEAVRAFHAGQIPGMATLDEAVTTWAERTHDDGPLDEPEDSYPPPEGPFRASDLTGEPPERVWVVDDWIVAGAVNSLYGDGGLGKTLLAQQLACSVATGVPWLGIPVKQGSVLAILCEDEKDELHRRHNAIKAAMGHTIGNPFNDVWLWPRVGDDNALIRWDKDSKPIVGAFWERIEQQIEALQPSLLILDTLADFYAGSEIDRPQVNYFVKTLLGGLIKRQAAKGHSLTILLLGHPSVAGKASGSGYSGSTAWNNAVRSRIYLTRPEEGSTDDRMLTRGKANYAKSGDETAIRLFFDQGVLHPCDDAEDGDSVLFAAREEACALVDKAWASGRPYAGRKEHPRYIFKALPADMMKAGFSPSVSRQALRELITDDAVISLAKGRDKRGYRTSRSGE